MSSRARLLSSKTLFRGRVFQLKRDRIIEPGNITATREVVEHPGSVVVLPLLPNGRVILIRQFRYPARKSLWELVAGSMEPGESVIRAARRELLEETGYRARLIKPVISFYSSPGFLTERMHLVEARDLTFTKANPEPDERIEVREFSRGQVKTLLREKRIRDGKTLVGLLWNSFA
jgi:ADP-ribose pyrophosphatase